LAGLAIFSGASLQQVGLVYTTAGKAGFITGLYVVIVPIMGLLWGQRTNVGTWGGALMAAVGMYLLSVNEDFTIAFGDLLELIGAVLWACHIHLIGWLSPKTDSLRLAFVQFMVCAAASYADGRCLRNRQCLPTLPLQPCPLSMAVPFPWGWPIPFRWWPNAMPTRPTPPSC
jgi:drug/metabolite transporter (DMT)-like permease